MPIYEYRCADCGAQLEKMQKITDAPLTVCESCGGKLEKQISRTGFQFKGSGWYVTDYSDKGKSAPPKSEAKSETETKTEKSSAGESTAGGDAASKPADGSPKTSKTE
ncbi:MAG: zinc ribbon domain-containing protein [Acidobacteriota bacterium]|nr:zinc ribbon domain-containing protein [Acidobacteriota bacterium]